MMGVGRSTGAAAAAAGSPPGLGLGGHGLGGGERWTPVSQTPQAPPTYPAFIHSSSQLRDATMTSQPRRPIKIDHRGRRRNIRAMVPPVVTVRSGCHVQNCKPTFTPSVGLTSCVCCRSSGRGRVSLRTWAAASALRLCERLAATGEAPPLCGDTSSAAV